MICKLSNNLSLDEMVVSRDYPDIAESTILQPYHLLNMEMWARLIFQPLRNKFGAGKVLSGLRSVDLNAAIGGSKTSDHMLGIAGDVYFPNASLNDVYLWIVRDSGLDYRQVILYPDQGFIHVSKNIPEKTVRYRLTMKEPPYPSWKHEAFVSISGDYIPFKTNDCLESLISKYRS